MLHKQELCAVDDADVGDLRLQLFRLVLHLLKLNTHGSQQPDGLHDERLRRVIRQHQHAGLLQQGGGRVCVRGLSQQQYRHAAPLFELQCQLLSGAAGDRLCDEHAVDAAGVEQVECLPDAVCVFKRDDARACEQGTDALGLRLRGGDEQGAYGVQGRIHTHHLAI